MTGNSKSARALKLRTWVPQADGTFLTKELSGPASYQAGEAGWNVFATVMLRLEQLSPSTTGEYKQRINNLATDWLESRGLVDMADDKAWSVQLERTRRRLEAMHLAGDALPSHDWWNKEVTKPAMVWLSRGGKGTADTPDQVSLKRAEVDRSLSPPKVDLPEEDDKPWGQGTSYRANQRRAKRERARTQAPKPPALPAIEDRKAPRLDKGKDKGKGEVKGKHTHTR